MSGTRIRRRGIEGQVSMAKRWKQRLASAVYGMMLGVIVPTLALGQATLLPNAKQQYLDDAGNPVASGSVTYYIPSTTTKKIVWQDAGKTTPQTNPVLLDAAGRPQPAGQTYGDGTYRQQVRDVNNVVIWDAVTTSTGGSGGGGGIPTIGDGDLVGTIKAWAGFQAPAQYVFSYGQAINRTSFPDLFNAITQAQTVVCTVGSPILTGVPDNTQVSVTPGSNVEASCVPPGTIVIGKGSGTLTLSANATVSTAISARFFFYGNGDGSTTFNLPDLRGRVIAGRDNMGSTSRFGVGRLDENFFAQAALGAAAGQQSRILNTPNLPAYTPAGTIAVTNGAIATTSNTGGTVAGSAITTPGGGTLSSSAQTLTSIQATSTATFSGTAQGGASAAFPAVQPTIETNYIIKTIPDTSSLMATGVASIQGMTGVLLCGSNTTCTGNIIDANAATPSSILFTQTGTGAVPESIDTFLRSLIWTPEMFGAVCSPFGTASASVADSTTAMTNSLAAADAFGGTLKIGPCVYKYSAGLTIRNQGTSIEGSSESSSTLLFKPTATGTALTIRTGTPTDIFWTKVRNLRIASDDTTSVKKGLNLIDVSNARITGVNITGYPSGYFTDGTFASRGFAINGHESTDVQDMNIYADFPLTIGLNPDQSISMDSFVFKNLTLISIATGNPSVTMETGICLYNTWFTGAQNWIGGNTKLKWIDTTSTCRSQGLYLSGIKSEQALVATGFTVDIEHNTGLLAFSMSNSTLGDTNGVKLRKVLNPIISNIDMQIPTGTGYTGIDVDTTVGTLQLDNSSWHSSVIASFGGLTSCQSSASLAANSTQIPPRGFFSTSCLESFPSLALTGTSVNRLLLGQGAGAVTSMASAGTATTLLHGGSPPTFSAVANADLVNSATTVNGQTCTLGSTCTVTAAAAGVVVGTTTVGGGTSGRVLYDNTGVLGEMTTSGSGTQLALTNTPTIASPTITGAFTATGLVTNADLATAGSNTVKGNATSGGASPTDLSVGSCSTAASALIWTINTGFGCNTSITAVSANVTTAVAITDDTTTNASVFPVWTASASGNLTEKVSSTKLSFNPSTGGLTVFGNVAASTYNNVGISSAGATATIGIGSGKNVQFNNTMTFAGTDSTAMTFPTTSATIARTDAAQTFTGTQTFGTIAPTTINAFTLGGTLSGGGNQINNVVLGASNPLAVTGTTITGNTSVASPLHIGGSGTTGTQLTLQTTTGNGTTDQFAFNGGNNGATAFGVWSSAGLVVGSNSPSLGTTIAGGTGPLSVFGTNQSFAGLRSTPAGSAIGAQFVVASTRGSTVGSFSAVQATDGLGGFIFQGDNGANYVQRGATIRAAAVTNWTGSQNDAKVVIAVTPTGGTSTVDALTVQQSGGVSIGTTTDPLVGGLQVNGQAFFPNASADTATTDSTACLASSGGKLLKGTGTLGICLGTSSARYKQDIVSMGAGLAEIVRLTPKNFFYKKGFGDGGKRQQYGFIAEDVVKVLPGVTAPDSAGKPNSVDMVAMIPILVNAVKQLKADNDNLRMDVLTLQAASKRR